VAKDKVSLNDCIKKLEVVLKLNGPCTVCDFAFKIDCEGCCNFHQIKKCILFLRYQAIKKV
jgi:hypothetical protein